MYIYFKNTDREIVTNENHEIQFRNTSTCWLCEKKTDSENGVSFMDHSHLTNKYKGPVH